MTIDDAIKILEDLIGATDIHNQPGDCAALEMGIEALKAWKEHRGTGSLMDSLLLPGETKE